MLIRNPEVLDGSGAEMDSAMSLVERRVAGFAGGYYWYASQINQLLSEL